MSHGLAASDSKTLNAKRTFTTNCNVIRQAKLQQVPDIIGAG
jgi:hypothetical protein